MLNEGTPVTPRPASSVLLVRSERPWRVLMMRRPGGAEFAPGAYVFPGGSVHEEDRSFSNPDRSAAVRELVEEVGVLLARRADGRFARREDALADIVSRTQSALSREEGDWWQKVTGERA